MTNEKIKIEDEYLISVELMRTNLMMIYINFNSLIHFTEIQHRAVTVSQSYHPYLT